MKNHKKIIHIILNTLVACVLFVPQFAVAYDIKTLDRDGQRFDRIFYFRNSPSARESLYTNKDSIDILAPQSYSFDDEGVLTGKVPDEVLAFTNTNHIDVMPLVTNGAFGQKSLVSILENRSIQDKAIKSMIAEARVNGFIGWQIDFEQMNVKYKDQFSEFIENAVRKFHSKNLILTVAVVTKISDNPTDYKKTLWNDLIGVYDYKRLGESADLISIMSYDAPDSKGAIAPYPWLVTAIEYAIKQIPPQKISLGIGLYYWKWSDVRGKLEGIGGFEGLKTALSQYNVKLGYSDTDKAPYMKYIRNKKSYTIWYENDQSVKEKISLIKSYGLDGFSAWALGLELPSVHLAVQR
jgi:spore germination protein YaaH